MRSYCLSLPLPFSFMPFPASSSGDYQPLDHLYFEMPRARDIITIGDARMPSIAARLHENSAASPARSKPPHGAIFEVTVSRFFKDASATAPRWHRHFWELCHDIYGFIKIRCVLTIVAGFAYAIIRPSPLRWPIVEKGWREQSRA